MSQAIAIQASTPAAGLVMGWTLATVTLTAEPYTNGTGLNIDMSPYAPPHWDIEGIINNIDCQSSGGHTGYLTTNPTATKPYQLNLRLYNGTTELSTGNVTATINLQIPNTKTVY